MARNASNIIKIKSKTIAICAALLLQTAFADTFQNAQYTVCFTPGGDCAAEIVDALNSAKTTILVQAYSFTSKQIARALLNAKKRGVNVSVILDKSQLTARYSSAKFLVNQNITTFIDYRVAIAHNKVIVIDNHITITGSYNFTSAAEHKNAENLLIIDDKTLAQQYTQNWYSRERQSEIVK